MTLTYIQSHKNQLHCSFPWKISFVWLVRFDWMRILCVGAPRGDDAIEITFDCLRIYIKKYKGDYTPYSLLYGFFTLYICARWHQNAENCLSSFVRWVYYCTFCSKIFWRNHKDRNEIWKRNLTLRRWDVLLIIIIGSRKCRACLWFSKRSKDNSPKIKLLVLCYMGNGNVHVNAVKFPHHSIWTSSALKRFVTHIKSSNEIYRICSYSSISTVIKMLYWFNIAWICIN